MENMRANLWSMTKNTRERDPLPTFLVQDYVNVLLSFLTMFES